MAKASSRAELLPALGEVFREHGYEGASLAAITARTGLGKGSLYHFFPGGKEEMAAAVLAEIDAWFEREVFAPLRRPNDPAGAVAAMFGAVDSYFRSGRRICLVGAFALGDARDRFADAVRSYFAAWCDALTAALRRTGRKPAAARALAEDVVTGIQGALVLARAVEDHAVFARALARLRGRVERDA